jgi:hypothetical protein
MRHEISFIEKQLMPSDERKVNVNVYLCGIPTKWKRDHLIKYVKEEPTDKTHS